MRRHTPLLLLGLAACQSGPTLAGGEPTPAAGHIFLARTVIDVATGSGGSSLHMTIDDDFGAIPVAPRRATPVVSPDGRHVAWLETTFATRFGDPSITRLYSYDRWTGDTHRVLGDEDRPGSPSWSRDPVRLAFTRTGTYIGGAPELFTVAPDGSHARRELTADALQGGSPSISPDARTVIVTNHSPRSRVEVIDLASGARRILAETPDSAPSTFLLHPAWSRDGRFVAMTVQSDTAILRVMDREGRVQVERDVDGDPQGLSWSPDGRQLAFCQSVPDPSRGRFFTRQEIVVWTLQTGLLRTITPQGASDCFPSWTR